MIILKNLELGSRMGNNSYNFKQISATYRQDNVFLTSYEESQSLYLNIYEGLFYCYLFYTFFAVKLNIDIPNLGAAWLFGLAMLTFIFRDRPPWRKLNLMLILLTAGSFFIIQVFWFKTEFISLKGFINWLPLAIIIDKLVTRRNFIFRLAIVMLIISVLMYPSVISQNENMIGGTKISRAGAEGTGIDNPNALGAWFGFCALVFWLWGSKQQWLSVRMCLWSCALVGAGLLSLTVSRGALLALFAGICLGFRRLKLWQRLSILAFLAALSLALYGSFVFTQAVESYQLRAFQQTGRYYIWPEMIEEIIKNPWIGSGIQNVVYFIPSLQQLRTPHNAILFLWVASGIVPITLFICLLGMAFVKAQRWTEARNEQSIDPLPIVAYAIILFQLSNLYFLSLWGVTALCYSFIPLSYHQHVGPLIKYRYIRG